MASERVGLVDYGMGNLLSVRHALESLGAETSVCDRPESLRACDRFVLPGVGAFKDCIRALRQSGFDTALRELVLGAGRPLLGICLGMQAIARRSYEGGEYDGLGWIDADVVRLEPGPDARVPQIGWNDVVYRDDSPLFRGLTAAPDFYFVHSYHLRCADSADVDATCEYGGPVVAAVRRGPVAATQFHPEKSQEPGLRVLQNFLQWRP